MCDKHMYRDEATPDEFTDATCLHVRATIGEYKFFCNRGYCLELDCITGPTICPLYTPRRPSQST